MVDRMRTRTNFTNRIRNALSMRGHMERGYRCIGNPYVLGAVNLRCVVRIMLPPRDNIYNGSPSTLCQRRRSSPWATC